MNIKRILTSLLVVGLVAGAAVWGTSAFFSDTETSNNNTFQAGALDLRIDSEAHYNGLICRFVEGVDPNPSGYFWLEPVGTDPNDLPDLAALEHYGQTCTGTWPERDLTNESFFNFADLKPGDFGENTISLHVYDNDAWGMFRVHNLVNFENGCTEPEVEASDPSCEGDNNGEGLGELQNHLKFSAWLDQGSIPGFQCVDEEGEPIVSCNDPEEGDNILNGVETEFWTNQLPTEDDWELSEILELEYARNYNGLNPDLANCTVVNGNTDYGPCHGLAEDGRMVGSTTYYFGLAWELPTDIPNVNIIQTDSLTASMSFDIEQWRNNDSPFE